MRPFKLFITLFSLSLVLVSCQKDSESTTVNPVTANNSTRDLNIPAGFNFATTENVTLNMNIEEAPLNSKYLLKVYTSNPYASATPVYQSFIANGGTINHNLSIPIGLEQLHLVMQAPDGSSFLTIVPKARTINHTFYQAKRGKNSGLESTGPNCTSGCDYTRSHSGNWRADDEEEVYCVTGSYPGSGSITIDDEAIVRLCGTGTIPNITINEGSLLITNGADVTVNNLNLNSDDDNELVVYQGGTLTITNWFTPNADFTNYGTMNVAAFNLNSRAEFENEGTFTVTGNTAVTINGDIDNEGTITIPGNVNVNSSADIKNECSMYFNGNVTLNGDIDNRSYNKIDGKITINGGGKYKLKNGALASVGSVHLNGRIEGSGSTSMFKVAGSSTANSGSQIRKNVEFCDLDGIENISSSIFKSGAKASCDLVIPTDPCNPEGNGVNTIADADNDGVADELDAYPNDPSRATDSYFPSENTYGTLAYEDLWPAYGDYDFNDLVVDYRYQQVINADNEVVDLKARFVTRAMGGSLDNGFGIQLDVAQNAVSSVTGTRYFNNVVSTNGNGTESGQSSAVIIIYDDASKVLVNNTGEAFVNTVSGNPSVDADTADITINFSTPQTIASLGTAPYNPFIFVDQTRGREVHLAGEAPTDLADQSLFGTIDDNTSINGGDNTYKSATNLPWAIHVVSGFDYPEERTDISQAYNFFSIWAQSGGASYPDWSDDQPGYINAADLYQ